MGDGAWFWYAKFLKQGARLYADLHLPLQPLFVLQTEWNMKLFGEGWLVSKLPAFLEMVVYILGIRWIAAYLPWNDWQKALLIACAFCFGTLFAAYRFDDYHLLADVFTVYSLVLLIQLGDRARPIARVTGIAASLGVLSGLSVVTRVNDGGMLSLSVLFALWVTVPDRRLLAAGTFAGAAALCVCAVIAVTGDTLRDYASFSIFHSAGSKGGLFLVARSAVLFPLKTLKLLVANPPYRNILLAEIVAFTAGLALFFRSRGKTGRLSPVRIIVILLPLVLLAPFLFSEVLSGDVGVVLGGVWILIALVLCAIVLVRALQRVSGWRSPGNWDSREALLLLPIGQLISSSMSSAGSFIGLYTPVGLFLLLLPIASPVPLRQPWRKTAILASVALMLLATIAFKIDVPFSWHTYVEAPMFTARSWYPHPLYGPMYVETRQLEFIEPLCQIVKRDTATPELLSLPYPYPNYFCDIKPWHGYIQTFFDTVSADTVRKLMDELDSAPPRWIVYQRQPAIIELHELFYHQKKPLQQRFLDEQIIRKLASGDWKKLSEWNSHADPNLWRREDNATWMLIRTR